jgi:hypothetical protein
MFSPCNLFQCVPRRLLATMDRFRVASVSEGRYSFGNGRFRRAVQPAPAIPSGSLGGRGPPRRRSRRELQALSNSLQLTSI